METKAKTEVEDTQFEKTIESIQDVDHIALTQQSQPFLPDLSTFPDAVQKDLQIFSKFWVTLLKTYLITIQRNLTKIERTNSSLWSQSPTRRKWRRMRTLQPFQSHWNLVQGWFFEISASWTFFFWIVRGLSNLRLDDLSIIVASLAIPILYLQFYFFSLECGITSLFLVGSFYIFIGFVSWVWCFPHVSFLVPFPFN